MNYKVSVGIIACILLFTSCEKVIDIKIKNSAPKIVIQGSITNQAGPYYVQITKSVDYDQENKFPPVFNATVIITDNTGYSESLIEIAPGVFQTQALEGIPGRSYTLQVNVEGDSYSATATMPFPVTIDSLTIMESLFFGEVAKEVVAWFKDMPGTKNYYRLAAWNNGLSFNRTYAFEDIALDGENIIYSMEPEEENENLSIDRGDTVAVELYGVDRHIYDYFFSLALYTGEGPPTSPANPLSNITNGALGYFSAHTVARASIVAP